MTVIANICVHAAVLNFNNANNTSNCLKAVFICILLHDNLSVCVRTMQAWEQEFEGGAGNHKV